MAGRTHGQPGAPITFGFKAASWADEIAPPPRPARARGGPLVGRPARRRGRRARVLRAPRRPARAAPAFCAELGLGDPGISWLTSRDRVAEFGAVLALVCGTLARIGNEVYELQRPEIGELAEPTSRDGRRQHHDAAQAQPRGAASTSTPSPGSPGRRPGVLLEGMVGATSATGGAGRPSGSRCPRSAC